jgi:hypothetical protein
MNTLSICCIVLAVVIVAIIGDISLIRTRRKQRIRRPRPISQPRHQKHLEEQMATAAFAGPRKMMGEVFSGFSIFRNADDIRMDVTTQDP